MIPSIDMMQQYAPNVAPQTIAAIIQVESSGNQYAIGINGPVKRRIRPRSVQEAATEARYWISKGYSVDLGLMQINSRNLQGLGITIEQAFDPAINIQAGAKILIRNYREAVKRCGPGQDALRAALSAYNTGNYVQGFKNGYVAKYFSGSGIKSGINFIVIKEPPNTNSVSASRNSVPSEALTSNPYKAELSIYWLDEWPETTTWKDIYQLQSPDTSLSVTDSQF
jgi:type IV secretion system protein VirB1